MTNDEAMPLVDKAFASIVITAQTFNPSIFSETWLTQNEIVPFDAFKGVRIFSPEVVQFQAAEMQVLIIPPKMQITFPINEGDGDFSLPQQLASRTVEVLPQTPYQALGLNFIYNVAPPAGQAPETFSRVLLGTGDYRLLKEFSESNAQFGRYFSKDYGDARLKLDIKPITVPPDQKQQLAFSFNFHHEVSGFQQGLRSDMLHEYIGKLNDLYKYSRELVSLGTVT